MLGGGKGREGGEGKSGGLQTWQEAPWLLG
jgi:hypothetical protein